MSYLNRIKHHPKAVKRTKRVGRGPGSGHGKTSGKGHKGQGQHGAMPRAGFEGGQMPLIRTTPKRGFSARSRAKFQTLNVSDLSRITTTQRIDSQYLFEHRYIDSLRVPVKILGDGELKHALHIKANAFSRSAVEKIEKAGGKIERIEVKANETKAEAAVRVGAKAKK